ncbi:MAG TPA: FAD-binding oxidoreductase [Solirubrobacteraceae bacterium]|nr:FAD-binding oxidoreductase [Solirubrobacteraceae bacterium]
MQPASFAAAAEALREAGAARRSVRIRGGASKAWGVLGAAPEVEIGTARLNRILEHNEGDLTAVLEAGVPLGCAQQQFAASGQMLALDPFLGQSHEATIGGVIATADAGPLRHRYGAPRDLILGMTVALSDGTLARSGGKVIKNVAGYDIGKLFCGSFGTLGMILSVSVRLHPLPARTVTALGVADDPALAAATAGALARAPLELEALDVAWRGGRGGLLARCGGLQARARAERVGALMRASGLQGIELVEPDTELWARQRAGQRSSQRALLRVAARPSALAEVLAAADVAAATVVGRAGLGLCFLELDPEALNRLTDALPAGAQRVLLDAPAALRGSAAVWGDPAGGEALELMRRVKARFDPARVCNPGVFVGGI